MSSDQTPIFTLYRVWPTSGQFDWSPFVTKVEFRLRHAGTKYTAKGGSTSQSPKGKLPYMHVDYGTKDDTFSDSTLIIKRLVQESHLKDLNADLSPEKKLEDLAIRSMLEDKLYFYHTYERWVQNYYVHRDGVLQHMSLPMRSVIGLLIYRSINTMLYGQGTGRFSAEEIESFRAEIWNTIENQLTAAKKTSKAGQPFWILGGSEPTEADACLFGFITSVLIAKSCPRSQEFVKRLPSVMDYAERIYKTYFNDYQHWDT